MNDKLLLIKIMCMHFFKYIANKFLRLDLHCELDGHFWLMPKHPFFVLTAYSSTFKMTNSWYLHLHLLNFCLHLKQPAQVNAIWVPVKKTKWRKVNNILQWMQMRINILVRLIYHEGERSELISTIDGVEMC